MIEVPILFQDDEIVAFNKPTGVPSQPLAKSPNEGYTVVSAALEHFPELKKEFQGSIEPGLLHRLDIETSGVLAFALTEKTHTRLRALWNSEHVRKTYRVQVNDAENAVRALQLPHVLNWPIAHHSKSKKRMTVVDRPEMRVYRGQARDARTTLVKIHAQQGDVLDLEVQLHTGVMHQIRAHLSHLGAPVVGDSIYRGPEASRLMLHAWKLRIDGREITAPLPW